MSAKRQYSKLPRLEMTLKSVPPVALQHVLNLTIEHLQHYFWMSHDFISVLNYQAYPFLYHPDITDVNQTLALAPDPPKHPMAFHGRSSHRRESSRS